MPGPMNGVDLAGEIGKRRPGLPVLLTSGNAEAARMQAGVAGVKVLPKPYRLEDLAEALEELRERHCTYPQGEPRLGEELTIGLRRSLTEAWAPAPTVSLEPPCSIGISAAITALLSWPSQWSPGFLSSIR